MTSNFLLVEQKDRLEKTIYLCKGEVFMKYERKELNQKVKIGSVIVIILLIILIAVFLAFRCNLFDTFKPDNSIENGMNYETLPDGTKVNNSEEIKKAEFTSKGVKASNFKISEQDGSTTITGKVENISDEKVVDIALTVKLYDSNDELAHEYLLVIPELASKEETNIQTNVMADFANVKRIHVEVVDSNIDKQN